MTIAEAIELIQRDIDDPSIDWDSPLGNAYKLSFEALKRVRSIRDKRFPVQGEELPGETED